MTKVAIMEIPYRDKSTIEVFVFVLCLRCFHQYYLVITWATIWVMTIRVIASILVIMIIGVCFPMPMRLVPLYLWMQNTIEGRS